MKKIFLSVIMFSLAIVLFSQADNFKNGFGFSAGMNSGVGLSYQHNFTKTAYKLTFGILAYNGNYDCYTESEKPFEMDSTAVINTTDTWEDSCEGNHLSGNFGAQYFYYLHQAKKSSFYLSFGVALFYSSQKYQNQKYKYEMVDSTHYQTVAIGDKYYTTENRMTINSGVGIGLDYNFTKNIVFSFGMPITFSYSDDNFRIYMYVPQASLMYFF